MTKTTLNIEAEIAQLEHLAIDGLRKEWRRLHQTLPPTRLSRDILLRGITYKLQENAFGGLSKSLLRKLQSSGPDDTSSAVKRQPRPSFKPGTRLVREWHGITHTVIMLANGIDRCRSLPARSPALIGLGRDSLVSSQARPMVEISSHGRPKHWLSRSRRRRRRLG